MAKLNRYTVAIILIAASIFATYAIYWWYFVRIPTGWSYYMNTTEGYSFIHPNSWIVTDCEDGEVVVAKYPINKCYFPSDAPKEYIDSLYFQVFLPNKSLIYYPYSSPQDNPPEKLQGWKSLTIERRDDQRMLLNIDGMNIRWDNAIPIKPTTTISANHLLKGNGEDVAGEMQRFYVNNLFRIGLVYNSSYVSEYKRIFGSIRFSKK